jgi:hydroxymethylpyrimidine/phosphomethylpyrimidine kinase
VAAKKQYYCVATIAGTDPSGGAGIQADIKTISATGGYAASIVTALVSQNTQGVQGIFAIPPEFIYQQCLSVFTDLRIRCVKIGMLANPEVIATIIRVLEEFTPPLVVLDPVMVAKDGSKLLPEESIEFLKQHLLSKATLITPNLYEAEKLLGKPIDTTQQMGSAARLLGERYQINVLMKGGHLQTAESADVVYELNTRSITWFSETRITTQNTHGTGCTLSAAIASYLAQGKSLLPAISLAKKYLTAALVAGSELRLGKGCGPVDHFFNRQENLACYFRE